MSNLSSQLLTVSDRVYLLSELDSVSRSFFTTAGSHDLSVLGLRSTSEDFWSQVLKDGAQNPESIEKLRQEIQSYRIIRVTLAIEPDRAFLEKMIVIFRKHIGENCIVEVEVMPSLSAGIQYTVDGKIIDRSLRTKIKEIDLKSLLLGDLPVLSS